MDCDRECVSPPPDGSVNNALADLEDKLIHIHAMGLVDIVLMGDMNIDMSKPRDQQTKAYVNLLKTYHLKQDIEVLHE